MKFLTEKIDNEMGFSPNTLVFACWYHSTDLYSSMSTEHYWHGSEVLRQKPVLVTLCLTQIIRGLSSDQTWASAVRDWYLSTELLKTLSVTEPSSYILIKRHASSVM